MSITAFKGWERGIWLKIPFIREGPIVDVFFHEIGHHIHHSIRPEFREREDVADVWMVRLTLPPQNVSLDELLK